MIALESEWHDGWFTRYWDCCKPSCSWPQNHLIPNDYRTPQCDANNFLNPKVYKESGCDRRNGPEAGFACFNQGPWQDASDPTLSYGFIALPSVSGSCNTCFEIDFSSSAGYYAPGDEGSRRLRGKRMIVQATNIGSDVTAGQMDLMIPGGGVGLFNGCAKQWGRGGVDMGVKYGGFLSRCQGCSDPGDGCVPRKESYETLRSCVADMCEAAFGENAAYADLRASCLWFVDWYMLADNPSHRYRRVECPAAVRQRLDESGRPYG